MSIAMYAISGMTVTAKAAREYIKSYFSILPNAPIYSPLFQKLLDFYLVGNKLHVVLYHALYQLGE